MEPELEYAVRSWQGEIARVREAGEVPSLHYYVSAVRRLDCTDAVRGVADKLRDQIAACDKSLMHAELYEKHLLAIAPPSLHHLLTDAVAKLKKQRAALTESLNALVSVGGPHSSGELLFNQEPRHLGE